MLELKEIKTRKQAYKMAQELYYLSKIGAEQAKYTKLSNLIKGHSYLLYQWLYKEVFEDGASPKVADSDVKTTNDKVDSPNEQDYSSLQDLLQ